MVDYLISALRTLNEIFTAGIAITAFSLLLYALTFNLRDRVARSFAIILLCVVVSFSGEAFGSSASQPFTIEFWLRFQWVGIVFLPAAYLQFSDGLLETTGRPSRGRRRLLVRLAYIVSLGMLLTLPYSLLVGPLIPDGQPVPHLERTWLSTVFTVYYAGILVFAWINFWRAYRRTVLQTSRRRMQYLIAGAIAPALGSYPYLLYGSSFASEHPLVFWVVATLSNILVTVLLVVMAYAVAFFGVSWPDRVVKRRLFKWIMRGPVTASTVLALTTLVRRAERVFGSGDSAFVPVLMVITVVLMEHLITLVAPIWERYLFHGGDEGDLRLLQTLEERLLTTKDTRQFLEAVLAAVCDQLQASTAFVAALGEQGVDFVVHVGDQKKFPGIDLTPDLLRDVGENDGDTGLFNWGDYRLLPLENPGGDDLIGLLGVIRHPDQKLTVEHLDALNVLGQRAALALQDRQAQQRVFTSLKDLTPQVELIQRLRAASRYNQGGVLTDVDALPAPVDLAQWVKGALSHYWGGPKLTQSPLMRLQVVQKAMQEHEDNHVNALRAILREAIESVRPEGERRFTAEWILYNILELKFMEGRKVREVAMRLAMSEADLYRKQRVAIGAVAQALVEMEQQARERSDDADGAPEVAAPVGEQSGDRAPVER